MINIVVKRPALSPTLKWQSFSLAPTWGDNYVQDASNSQNYNRYAYCLNNPLKYTDPTGNNWEDRMQNGLARVTNPLRKFGDSFDRFQNNITGQSSTYSTVASGGLSAGSVAYSSAGQQMATGRKGGFTDASGRFISNQTLVAESHAHCKKRDLMKDLLIYKFQVNKEGEILNLANATVYGYRSDKLYDFLAGQGHAIEQYVNLNNDAQSNGGENSTSTFWNNVNTGIGAFDVGQGAKGELINYAAKSSPAINDLKYVKGMKVLGGATFVTSSVISGGLAINYYNNGGTNNSVWMKSALDIGMGYVGFLGPIGFGVSATYFLLDAGGAFQGWGDPLTTPKR